MKIKIYSAALMASLMLAACSNDAEQLVANQNAVEVHATVGAMAQGRVTLAGDAFQNGDKIHVTNATTGAVAGKDASAYAFDGTSWTAESTMVWADGENTFEAYYPYSAGSANSFSQFTVHRDQSTLENLAAADWMTATATKSKSADNHSIDLAFKHELAKVTFTITGYGDEFNGTIPDIEDVAIHVPSQTAEISNKTITNSNSNFAVQAHMSADASGKGLHSFTAIVPAGTYDGNDELLVIGSRDKAWYAYTNDFLINTGLEAGKSYNFNIFVGKNVVSIGSVSVTDWATAEPLDDGIANEVSPFTDANFVKVLKEKYNVPVNANGEILLSNPDTKAALDAIINLDVSNKSISSLAGIEFMPNLTYLLSSRTQLTSLNLEKNVKLEVLNCAGNNLTELNLEKNVNLKNLNCSYNQLTALNVEKNVNLGYLYCSGNKLTELNVDYNVNLMNLNCSYNQLTALDITKNQLIEYLLCGNQTMASDNARAQTLTLTLLQSQVEMWDNYKSNTLNSNVKTNIQQ